MSTIYFSPITSLLENKPNGTLVIGNPGSGKTFFLLNLATNCILTSCRILYLDPKNDSMDLKLIDNSIKVTDINKIRPGGLNPFKVLKYIDSNIILSIISSICGDITNEQLVDITPIVQDFVNYNRENIRDVSLLSLANYLYASESREAQTIGTILKVNEDSKYGKLLFSKSDDETFDIGSGSEVISLFGLPLPDSTENMNQEQRFSSAIIYIICKKLREILESNSKIPTVIFIDEAKILYSNPAIANVMNDILILGRSLNTSIVLASQAMSHFPLGISQFISNKFMFASSNREARLFLDEFDNSDDDQGMSRDSIINFVTSIDVSKKEDVGKCFFIDSKGRGGFIKIKSNLGFTSNPLLKKREKTVKINKNLII